MTISSSIFYAVKRALIKLWASWNSQPAWCVMYTVFDAASIALDVWKRQRRRGEELRKRVGCNEGWMAKSRELLARVNRREKESWWIKHDAKERGTGRSAKDLTFQYWSPEWLLARSLRTLTPSISKATCTCFILFYFISPSSSSSSFVSFFTSFSLPP